MNKTTHYYFTAILESHLDFFGHVHHTIYLKLLEEARWDWITQQGCGLEYIQNTQIGPIVLKIQIEFQQELRLRQKIEIQTRCVNQKKKLVYIEQKIFSSNKRCCCTALFTMGFLNLQTRKLVAPSPTWIQALID